MIVEASRDPAKPNWTTTMCARDGSAVDEAITPALRTHFSTKDPEGDGGPSRS